MSALLAVEIPYWGQSLLRVLAGILAVLLPAGTIVYVFLFKMMSFMQSRLGPMEAGPYGSLQLVAEVGKWMQKEDLDAIISWSLKVREMYLDIESRREDARDAGVESVRRLEETWARFRELGP